MEIRTAGHRTPDTGHRTPDTGHRTPDTERTSISAVRSHRSPGGHRPGHGLADDAGRGNFYTDPDDRRQEGRRLLAETVGTFALTVVAAGAVVIDAVSPGSVGRSAAVVAPALLVTAMIYTLGDVSGAHLNPAVTLAFAVRGDFPWRRLPGYWLAQAVGATAAAGLLRAMFGPVGHLGATLPHDGTLRPVVMETLLTWLLVTVILGTADGHRLVGHNAALAVGGYIALAGLFASPISGASMNPARSLGPDVASGHLSTYWVYLVGPVLGALTAVALTAALRGPADPDEHDAAQG